MHQLLGGGAPGMGWIRRSLRGNTDFKQCRIHKVAIKNTWLLLIFDRKIV
jgi:hypothetical protein